MLFRFNFNMIVFLIKKKKKKINTKVTYSNSWFISNLFLNEKCYDHNIFITNPK